MGGTITDYEDGFTLSGIQGKLKPFHVQSNGDHRIAMSAIIAAIAGNVEATIDDVDCINTSFPNFFTILKTLGISVELRKTT
jgi:3-phosphoshikimate 1-carboxyvinyltransferase